MPAPVFDGPNLIIQLPSAESAYDAQIDLYSEWKGWAAQGNLFYPPAFDTTGGDPIDDVQSISPYFFCRNDLGWRIRTPEDNGRVFLLGNLYPRDSNQDLYVQAQGFTCFLSGQVSSRSQLIETGISGLTEAESANLKLIPALL